MEEMYEVLKFIDHGAVCRRSLDCVQGVTLMQYLKEHPMLGRRLVLTWFRDLARCLEQYHRSGNGQNYRYLNPYSIIAAEEGAIMLLDLEAPDNAAVLKRMQTGAVRDHFLKPVCGMGVSRDREPDLFAYGKVVQFMLAYAEITPALNGWEEMRLQRLISRCTGEKGKKYEDFSQVLKSLPPVPADAPDRHRSAGVSLRSVIGGVGLGAAACLFLCVLLGVEKKGLVSAEAEEIYEEAELETEERLRTEYENELDMKERQEEAEREQRILAEEIAGAADKAAIAVWENVGKIELNRMKEELSGAYERLLELETDPVAAEEIRKKKDELK